MKYFGYRLARFIPNQNCKTRPNTEIPIGIHESRMNALKPAVSSLNRRRFFLMSVLSSQLFLNACAANKYIFHSFSFDAVIQSPDIEVLDYQYGSKSDYEREGGVGIRAAPYRLDRGDIFTGVGTTGTFPKGEYLYVKWRVKNTGHIYEDKVDLTTRLPKDITQHTVHFVIEKDQLYVYLIPPPRSFPLLDYSKMRKTGEYADYFKKHQIYPN